MSKLEGRVAIVTGAAQGIGRATAERLLADGAKVLLADLDLARTGAAARELDPGGKRARGHAGDVSRKATAAALVDAAVEAFGRVDILVNNAGITHAADFLDLAEEDFDRVLAVNLKGMFLCGQAAARRMVAQGGGGAIVNLSSANAVVAIPNQVPYVVSKGGVNQLTKVMALALAPHRIRVNGVGPGTIMTDLMRNAVLKDSGAKTRILSRTPMSRFGETSEIASVIAFLVSDDASYLTGQTIYPDGGRLALNYTVPVPPEA
jgi:NAD(P)-dependent dehydrogenase (short-subunit alcohol dehydrogenase family)